MSQKRSKTFPVTVKQESDLKDERTTILFPAVFSCLVNWYNQNNWYFIFKFPLSLRLVCSDWNKAIEQYYQTTSYPLANKSRFLQIGWENAPKVGSCIKLLAKFGQQVESMKLQIYDPHDSPSLYYLMLPKVLKNLPALKSLVIYYETPRENFPDKTKHLDETIGLNPCPELRNLTFLFVYGCLDNRITIELLRRSRNIVKIEQLCPGFQPTSLDYSINLSKITELDLTIRANDNFQQLKQFGGNWKIKKFRGDFAYLMDEHNWLDIFIMLGKNWLDSLEDLNIILPKVSTPKRNILTEHMLKLTTYGRLELPKLRRIEIFPIVPIALDFLLPSKYSLESIYIKWFGDEKFFDNPTDIYIDAMDHQVVEYLGSERELEKSNIWSCFLKLQSVLGVGESVDRPAKFK